MASQGSTVLHQIGHLVKNTKTHSLLRKKTKQNSSEPCFRKKLTRTAISPLDLPGCVSLLTCRALLLLSQAAGLFQHFCVNQSPISKKTEWTHGSAHSGDRCIYSVNFWTYSINVLLKQAPELCFPAYLRVSVKQLNHVIHHLRHDMLLASSHCPWQVGSSYKSFGASKWNIDWFYFAYFILKASSPEVGVSEFLRNTAPRNNKALAQTWVESKRRVVQLQLKSDCLEKLSKYLWVHHPH